VARTVLLNCTYTRFECYQPPLATFTPVLVARAPVWPTQHLAQEVRVLASHDLCKRQARVNGE
jgi:hypothetical protein